MWVRKSKLELETEQKQRRAKGEKLIIFILAIVSFFILWKVGSVDNLLIIAKRDFEMAFSLVFLPIFVYFGYRNYVLHGSVIERPSKICLTCGNGMGGGSDDGWGFKVYGTKKREWYQFRACKTPEKCDIAYQFEVKWVDCEE